MKCRKVVIALGGAALMGMVGVAHADTTPANADVQSELSALRARVNELEGKQSQTWLDEQRAAEVKALVKEVLSDADTRASLAESSITAGHDKHFFLASEDGNYRMNIEGNLQVRYTWDHRHGPGNVGLSDPTDPTSDLVFIPGDEDESGFDINRAQITFDGHVVNPNWIYTVRLAADRNDGGLGVEIATIGYRVMDNLTVKAGRFKAPFLHEDMVDDMYQLAVDRSIVTNVFSAGYIEGVVAQWDVIDMVRITGTIDDGSRSGNINGNSLGANSTRFATGLDFENDSTDIALGGRVDVKIMGDWNQYDDLSSWSGDDTALFVGGAFRWDVSETGDINPNDQTFSWTVDATFKMAGLTAYGAVVGSHFMADDSATGDPNPPKNVDFYGFEAQVGYQVIPDKLEPFGRFEYIRVHDDAALVQVTDTAGDTRSQQEFKALTAGVNYYVNKHEAKFTLDAVWALDPVNPGFGDLSGIGLLPDAAGHKNQTAVRAQFQLMF